MDSHEQSTDVLVIGAGVSGLVAAIALQRAGRRVCVADKGRGVGGRLATRRIEDATFDHGSPCFTVGDSTEGLRAVWDRLSGSVTEWGAVSEVGSGGRRLWRGVPSMSAVAKRLAGGMEVHQEVQIATLRRASAEGPNRGRWIATAAGGRVFVADAVVATPPVPQCLALLDAGGVGLSGEVRASLSAIEYDRCLTVMAVLEAPSLVPPPGSLSPVAGPIALITDNQRKGISAVPAVTLQATPEFSLEHWEQDRQESGKALLAAAEPWLGAGIRTWQIHGWRYSRPRVAHASPCVIAQTHPILVLAGDAFGGDGVDGAARSGWAAAEAILARG